MSRDARIEILREFIAEHDSQSRADERPALSYFRIACAIVCTLIAIVFLTVNSVMLGRFGFRMGHDETEQWSQAIIAASIPWVLALFPFLLMATWVPRRTVTGRNGRLKTKRGRPSVGTVGAIALYLVFVVVNFIGGIGVNAVARQHVAGKAQDASDEGVRLKSRKADLEKQLASISAYRPTEEVESLIKRQQQHRFWQLTGQCSADGSITSRAQRNYCTEYDTLKAELGRGKSGNEIRAKIEQVDAQLSNPVRSSIIADDAQAKVLSENLGIEEHRIRLMLPLMWPVLLELGSMLMAYFALKLFRISHHTLVDVPEQFHHYVPPPRQLAPPSSGSGQRERDPYVRRMLDAADEPEAAKPLTVHPIPAPIEDPVLQREVFDEFWRTRVRQVASGQVPESTFYAHYQALCAQRHVSPYDLPTFRRLSGPHLDGKVVEMAGVRWWCQLTVAEG